MADVEYGDYIVREGSRLSYNDGTGPKRAHAGETVNIPKHLAEGEFASRLNFQDGRPVQRSRWSLADIQNAPPEERAQMIQSRRARLQAEQEELDRLASDDQSKAPKGEAAAGRRANIAKSEGA